MSRQYRFHADVHGDSLTIETRPRLTATEVEVLVNGKVVGAEQIHGAGVRELAATLPGPPQGQVRIRVSQPEHHAAPQCQVFVDGIALDMQTARISD